MTTRATNPTGASLLDQSTAKPGNIDMAIFQKQTGTQTGQGSVSSDYLQKTREDNPAPERDTKADSVSLADCRITTDSAELSTDQPFEMSVSVKMPPSGGGGSVTFKLFCTFAKSDGTDECEDQSSPSQAVVTNGTAAAKGTLVSPKTPVKPGTRLKYHVVATHPGSSQDCESPKAEVVAGKPPKPLAVWSLGAVHFGFDSSFVLPSAAEAIQDLREKISQNPKAAVAVFGHADPVGQDDYNKRLSGRRAYAVFCLLARKADGWKDLAKGSDGDKWDLRTTQTMLTILKDASGKAYYGGSVDGRTGPKTEAAVKAFQKDNGLKVDGIAGPETSGKLYAKYMDGICEVSLKDEDFVGDPQDAKRQWACVGCGEFNPLLVFSKADSDAFERSGDKSARNARNAPNRRATVMLFPETAKGPGKVVFPCPAWTDGPDACRKQAFEDADARRNPSDAQRTWEKDKDTFACRFYADISTESKSGSARFIEIRLVGSDDSPVANAPYRLTFSDGSSLDGTSDSDGYIRHPDNEYEGSFKLVLNPPAA